MADTFGTLKARIQQEVNKPSTAYLTPIGNAIVSAIRFYEKTPAPFNEVVASLTLSSGDSSVALPADYALTVDLKLYDTNRYFGSKSGFSGSDYVSVSDYLSCNANPCRPAYYAVFGNNFYFSAIANKDYSLRLAYNNKDTAYPSGDNDTSLWFGDGLDIIRYHAMGIFYSDTLHSDELAGSCFDKAALCYGNLVQNNNNRDKFNLVID